jgi:hypothetical protein
MTPMSIVRWTVAVGILWFVFMAVTQLLLAWYPTNIMLQATQPLLTNWGPQLGSFIAPILQLALVAIILLAAAERLGFVGDAKTAWSFAAFSFPTNVQAFIAVAIIGATVIAALGGIGNAGLLKDLALVVLGFYFGTRRREADIKEAVEVGTAAGVAASQAGTPPAGTTITAPETDRPAS